MGIPGNDVVSSRSAARTSRSPRSCSGWPAGWRRSRASTLQWRWSPTRPTARSSSRSSPTRWASASSPEPRTCDCAGRSPRARDRRMSATMIEGYRHRPGNHCGSTALRNLLAFDGIEISEEMALGLGAGVCFYYVPLEGQSPSRFTNGRVGRLEEQFLRADRRRASARDLRRARRTRGRRRAQAVDGGRPALLLTDLYYLDHYGRSAHFPGHAVVLAGYDERGRLPLGHRLRGAADDEARAPRRGSPRRAPGVPARGPDADRPRPGAAARPAPGRGGGDRAQRPADARAGDGRVRGAAGAAALRRRACPSGPACWRTGSGRRASATR